MSGKTNNDRRSARRQATIDEIVAAAWELSRRNGLGNFSMRDLGAEVGMRAQSLYGYFSSKLEIFDAMFCEGNRALIDHLRSRREHHEGDNDLLDRALSSGRGFFSFCTGDPVRYQLLFQRTIPGFEPSPESYAVAQEAFDFAVDPFRALGRTESEVDLFVAVLAGLIAQQISNEPGGDRWEKLLEPAFEMLLHEFAPELATTSINTGATASTTTSTGPSHTSSTDPSNTPSNTPSDMRSTR